MSLSALTIVTNLLEKKNYTEKDIKKCLFETCHKVKLGPNEVIEKLLHEYIKDINFPIFLEGYGEFNAVEQVFEKLLHILKKTKEDSKFKFSFKSFDKKNTLYSAISFITPTTFRKKYEIRTRHRGIIAKVKDFPTLTLKDMNYMILDVKLSYLTSSNPEYDSDVEGYDEDLESGYEKEL